jgi:DNA-binding transcriptional ArsR family regulator
MLETLITSKTRIKLLVKFFLKSDSSAYLRGLENELGESSNAVRLELNRFEKAGLLKTHIEGNKKLFKANPEHPLFKQIHEIVVKHLGIDQIIDHVANKLGSLDSCYLTGEFAEGKDSSIIDVLFVGDHIDKKYLLELVDKAEKYISRKIRYMVFTLNEFKAYQQKNNKDDDMLLLWKA